MGRKALTRYGGSTGRRLAAAGPEVVPWAAVRSEPAFQDFVRTVLPDGDSRVARLLNPAATSRLVDASLAGGSLYPLGLVLTLELTLRRLDGAKRR